MQKKGMPLDNRRMFIALCVMLCMVMRFSPLFNEEERAALKAESSAAVETTVNAETTAGTENAADAETTENTESTESSGSIAEDGGDASESANDSAK